MCFPPLHEPGSQVKKKIPLVGLQIIGYTCLYMYFKIKKIWPLGDFWENALFLRYRGGKTTLEWSKLVFETIYPLKGGTFILKRGLRFSFSVDVPFTGVRKRLTYFFVPEILFFWKSFFCGIKGKPKPLPSLCGNPQSSIWTFRRFWILDLSWTQFMKKLLDASKV